MNATEQFKAQLNQLAEDKKSWLYEVTTKINEVCDNLSGEVDKGFLKEFREKCFLMACDDRTPRSPDKLKPDLENKMYDRIRFLRRIGEFKHEDELRIKELFQPAFDLVYAIGVFKAPGLRPDHVRYGMALEALRAGDEK